MPLLTLLAMQNVMDVNDVILVVQETGEYLLIGGPDRNKTFSAGRHIVKLVANRINEFSTGPQRLADKVRQLLDGPFVGQVYERVTHAYDQVNLLCHVRREITDVVTNGFDT